MPERSPAPSVSNRRIERSGGASGALANAPEERPEPVRAGGIFSFFDSLAARLRRLAAMRREVLLSAAVAALTSLLFYWPSLRDSSKDAGYIYTGDFWHVWLPQLAKLTSLFSKGAFSGIDLS